MKTSDHQEELQRDSKAYGPLFANGPKTFVCRICGKEAQRVPGGWDCDHATGQQLKEKGIREVSEHNENWMERALLKAKYFVGFQRQLDRFTGEDIRLFCKGTIGDPKHPNAYGALINTLIKRKIIVPTGEHRQMKDSRSHARSTPVYKAT